MDRSLLDKRLARVADSDGCLRVLALDHRDSLRVEFDADNPATVADSVLVDFKRDLLAGLATGTHAQIPSGVMLEPEYSVPDLIDDGTVPAEMGVICALEAQGYFADPDQGNQLLAGWSPARAAEVGASAGKLLLLYRPDRPQTARGQEQLVAEVVAMCAEASLPLFVEPVPYDVVDEVDRLTVIASACRRLSALDTHGLMVMKAPFPGSPGQTAAQWAEACAVLNDACGDTPWATLSWGVGFEEFSAQLSVAIEHGCSGFMAGRAIWRDALDSATRAEALTSVVPERFEALARLTDGAAPITQERQEESP